MTKNIFYSSPNFISKSLVPDLMVKSSSGIKMIDVGGTMGGFSQQYVDYFVDINNFEQEGKKVFVGNICETSVWEEIENFTKLNGKFDFSICSHTLEDISNPSFVCNNLEKISNSGIILVPSKYHEMCRHEGQYRGWIHHRWIYSIENSNLVGYPKINYIEYNSEFDNLCRKKNEDNFQIVLQWEKNINLRIVNEDFLGPDIKSVIEYYNNLLYEL